MPDISLIPEQQKERSFARATSFRQPEQKWSSSSKTALVVLVVLAAVTGGLFVWSRSLKAEEESLRQELRETIMERDSALESRLTELDKLLDSFETLLARHRRWTKLFDVLETRSLSAVTFTSFEGSYQTATAILKGLSPNYNLLAQQIKSLEADGSIGRVDVSNVKINKQGLVEFNLQLVFNKSVLKQ